MEPEKEPGKDSGDVLSGTTLRVYRYLYRQGRPLGVHEVQRGTGIQSPSTAHYHLRKLVEAGIAREEEGGYIVNRRVYESMIRVGRSLVPVQIAFVAFFATILLFLLTVLRPGQLYAIYALALLIDCVSLCVFSLQAILTLRRARL